MEKVKRAEFLVEAPDDWGIERGLNLAYQTYAKDGSSSGRTSIPGHNVLTEWRVSEVVKSDPAPAPLVNIGPSTVMPNIAVMDIEEAKGVVGTAGTIEELDLLANIEKAGSRTPGGRKGVLDYIEKLVAEKAAIARGEALAEPEPQPVPPPVADPVLQPAPVPSDVRSTRPKVTKPKGKK